MSDGWYAAFALLTLLSVANAAFLVSVMRQVGVLHQRIRPTGAGPNEGPEIGTRLPILEFDAVGTERPSEIFSRPITLLGHVSPGCSLCDDFATFTEAYARNRDVDQVDIFLITDASRPAAEKWLSAHPVDTPLLRNEQLMDVYSIPGSPYVLALRPDGDEHVVVAAAGVVNTLEQLEDLVEVAEINLKAGSGNGSKPADGAVEDLAVISRVSDQHPDATSGDMTPSQRLEG